MYVGKSVGVCGCLCVCVSPCVCVPMCAKEPREKSRSIQFSLEKTEYSHIVTPSPSATVMKKEAQEF